MLLYVIRHAWAGSYGDPAWPDDSRRPLTDDGKLRFAEMMERLSKRGFAPGIVATSPLVRCRQTAQIVAESVAGAPDVEPLDALRPGSDLPALVEWTARQSRDHDEIAWVGHSPDVGQLTAALLGSPPAWIRFAKGGVAAIRFDDAVAPNQGELRWLATAKLLGC